MPTCGQRCLCYTSLSLRVQGVKTCLIKERFHIKAMKGLKTYSFFTDIETDPEPVLCNIRVDQLFSYSSKTGGSTVPVVEGQALWRVNPSINRSPCRSSYPTRPQAVGWWGSLGSTDFIGSVYVKKSCPGEKGLSSISVQ